MRTRGLSVLLGALVAVLAAAGCSGADAVEDPTWEDVFPILQGQCLFCHGSTADADGGSYRFDLLDAIATCRHDDQVDDIASKLSPPASFMAARRDILTDIRPTPSGGRPKMPPEPGRTLESWQARTIENFIRKVDAMPPSEAARLGMGPRPPEARSPRIDRLSFVRAGSSLTVRYVVSDENADPVIGQLLVGDTLVHQIQAAGAGQARFDLKGAPTGDLQIRARLCDGWGIRTRDARDALPVIPN